MEEVYDLGSDNIQKKDFLDKKNILQFVSEEEIFELVFGFKPVEYQYVTSPFREDNTPGCWFERSIYTGKLKFIDYADNLFQDCFGCVQKYFKLPNFYSTLIFIQEHLINGKNLEIKDYIPNKVQKKDRKKVEIHFEPKLFNNSDRIFWSKYGISSQNLIDDKVFSVKRLRMKNTKKGDFSISTFTNCYAYTEFDNERKKLYFPYRRGKKRFITNCTKNDIGNYKILLEPFQKDRKQLVITKSYKDCRVLLNQGVNCIWLQNEGMIPDDDVLFGIVSNYEDIVIFFDNDSAGKKATIKLLEHINLSFPIARGIAIEDKFLIEGITDSSDLRFKKGEKVLHQFLLKNNILKYE